MQSANQRRENETADTVRRGDDIVFQFHSRPLLGKWNATILEIHFVLATKSANQRKGNETDGNFTVFFYKKLDIAIEFTEFSRGSREMFRRLFFKVVPSLIERYRVFCSFMMCQSNSFGSLKVNDTAEDKAKENSVC